MRDVRSSLLYRSVSLVLSASLLVSVTMGSVSAALAAEPSAAPSSGPSLAGTTATPVRPPGSEIVGARSATASSYQLASGKVRTVISQVPVNFRDSSGQWQPIDDHVVAAAPGVTRNAAGGFSMTFADGHGASVGKDGWSVDLDLLGAPTGSPVAAGDRATYLGVARSTNLVYEPLSVGLKETLVLAAPDAPTSFTFRLTAHGAAVKRDEGSGGWALFAPGSDRPVAYLGELLAWDSSGAKGAYAPKDAATTFVMPVEGGALVTYSLSPKWLSNPHRVFPVYLDPTVAIGSSLWRVLGYNAAWEPTTMLVGRTYVPYWYWDPDSEQWIEDYTLGGNNYSCFKFDVSSINGTMTAASFRIRQTSGSGGTVGVWQCPDEYYWNQQYQGLPGSDPYSTKVTDLDLGSGGTTATCSVTSLVAGWIANSSTNHGILLEQNSGSDYQQFPASSAQLVVDYTPQPYTITPSKTGSGTINPSSAQTVQLGDSCTFTITPDAHNHINAVNVDGTYAGTPSTYTFSNVQANHTISAQFTRDWFTITASAGSHGAISPSGAQTVWGGDSATFTITPDAAYAVSDVTVDGTSVGPVSSYTFADVGASHTISASFALQPGPTQIDWTKTSSAGSSWYTESVDASGNPTNPANTGDAGRGVATIGWKPASGISSQNVYLFDGYDYRKVASGLASSATTWSTSATPTLWPTDSAIAAMSANRTSNPLGGGLALRDDPRPLYAKMSGTTVDDIPAYFFKVTGVASGVEAPVSDAPTITVQLPNRSIRALREAPDTFWDAGDMAGNSAQVALSTVDGSSAMTPGAVGDARLMLSATDLSVPSYGPAATVSRTYRSDLITSKRFGQGWVFDFDRKVAADSGAAVYTDGQGVPHRFVQMSSNEYRTPPGMVATLTPSGGGFVLEQQGGDRSVFDATGKLASVTDRNGNQVTYTWNGSTLTITAANNRSITVNFSGDWISSASFQGRTFNYASDSNVATVTCYAGSADAHDVVYSYGSGRVTGVSVPAFAAVDGKSAHWGFTYTGPRVDGITYPGYGQGTVDPYDRQTLIYYYSGKTVIERVGQIGGAAHQALGTKFMLFPDGSTSSQRDTLYSWIDAGGVHVRLTSFEYAPTLDVLSQADPVGSVTRHVLDGRRNELISLDALGNATTTTYGPYDNELTTTDSRGAVTADTYDGAGNLTRETKTIDATTTTDARYAYDSRGCKTSEQDYVSASHAITTTYTTDACGEASGETIQNVALDASASVVGNVTTSKTFDMFGNATAETDALGKTTSHTFSSGTGLYEISSTDPSGTVTSHTYGVLGNETGSWVSVGGQISAATSMTVLPTGEVFTQVQWADAAHTQVAEATTHTIDPLGHEISTASSLRGTSSATFDELCQKTDETDESGLVTHYVFDDAGKVTKVTAPGNPDASSTVTAYDACGRESQVTNPDGSWTSNSYDACGNRIAVVTSTASGSTTETSTFDLAGRVTSTTSADQTTYFTYDLLGRKTGSGVAGSTSLTTAYNDAGWVVRDIDAAGVVTSSTLDAVGRVTRCEAGGQITASAYDACGRLLWQSNPDGTSVSNTYDVFGRLSSETHLAAGGAAALKILVHAYDFAGRETSVTSQLSNLVRTTTYATSPTSGSSTSLIAPARGSAVTLSSTSTVTSAGREGAETMRWDSAAFPTSTLCATRAIAAYDSGGRVASFTVTVATSTVTAWMGYDASSHWVVQTGLGLSANSAAYAQYGSDGRKSYDRWPTMLGGVVSHTYAYNDEGRLTRDQLSEAGGAITSDNYYDFDSAAEITHAGPRGGGSDFTYSGGHLTSATISGASRSYAYDTTLGRRTSSTSGGVTTNYSYDGAGHLTSVTVGGSRIATFTYDAAGQRMSSDVTASGTRTQTSYLYESIRLHSLTATLTSSGATSTFTIGYAYAGDGRPYAGVYEASSPTTRTLFTVLTNDRGDVTELIDGSGMAFARYRYDAWGTPLAAGSVVTSATYSVSASLAADIANRQPLRYAGYAWDQVTGLYYCSQRYYDPATFQWLTADPAKADGEESAYQYCGGDPVGGVDPTGQVTVTQSGGGWLNAFGCESGSGEGGGAAVVPMGTSLRFSWAVTWTFKNSMRLTVQGFISYRNYGFANVALSGRRQIVGTGWKSCGWRYGNAICSREWLPYHTLAYSYDFNWVSHFKIGISAWNPTDTAYWITPGDGRELKLTNPFGTKRPYYPISCHNTGGGSSSAPTSPGSHHNIPI